MVEKAERIGKEWIENLKKGIRVNKHKFIYKSKWETKLYSIQKVFPIYISQLTHVFLGKEYIAFVIYFKKEGGKCDICFIIYGICFTD